MKISILLSFLFLFGSFAEGQNSCQPPQYFFNNKTNVSGTGGLGSVYRFNSVLSGIDAIVTITKVQNALIDNNNVDNSAGYGNAWQPFITFPNAKTLASDSSYLEFKVEFRATALPSALVPQNCMAITIVDCDGNGSANSFREMVKVSLPGTPLGIQSSSITVFQDNRWIMFKSGTSQFNNIDTLNVAAMAQVKFPLGISSFYVRVGVVGPVTANTQRQASLYLKSFPALSVPLPLHLSGFTGLVNGNDVKLHCLSTNEVNFSHFDVYRSLDGENFVKVGTIQSNGNQNAVNEYSYTDPNIMGSGTNTAYYKLRMNDYNGNQLWSHTINVRTNSIEDIAAALDVYPNPALNILNIQFPDLELITSTEISDIYGKVVVNTQQVSAGESLSIDLSNLESGMYIFSAYTIDGAKINKTFIKQ